MTIVGALSEAGKVETVLFYEYKGSPEEEKLLDGFFDGLDVALDRKNIYCIAALTLNGELLRLVGIYYHKEEKACMVFEKDYEDLSVYVEEIFNRPSEGEEKQ